MIIAKNFTLMLSVLMLVFAVHSAMTQTATAAPLPRPDIDNPQPAFPQAGYMLHDSDIVCQNITTIACLKPWRGLWVMINPNSVEGATAYRIDYSYSLYGEVTTGTGFAAKPTHRQGWVNYHLFISEDDVLQDLVDIQITVQALTDAGAPSGVASF